MKELIDIIHCASNTVIHVENSRKKATIELL
jgi:hypothetical protein